MNEFIKKNIEFWSSVPIKNGDKKLLIEEPRHPAMSHVNAVFARMLNQAQGYEPVWLNDGINCQDDLLLRSYFPGAQIVRTKKRPFYKKIYVLIIALINFFKVYRTRDILNFCYDDIKYGDILYDTYLFLYHKATIKKIDFRLVRIMASIILRHKEIKKILQDGNYAGVLVSHQVGVDGGVLLRVALHCGYRGYLSAGQFQLECFTKINEIYDYIFKAFPSNVDEIIENFGLKLENIFLDIFNKQVSGKGGWDGLHAFSSKHKYFKTRESFNKFYHLDSSKKNVFLMLHVFNDHPHSHFRWMLFRDYYDWFFQTLEFAKKHSNVNWIFKQHPSAKFYPTVDVSVDEIFKNCPPHITYINEKQQIDSRSLVCCSDLVITCLGSAGFEYPAMAGIPSLTAGDNFYTGLGFAKEPKTKSEYFEFLKMADKVEKLPVSLQRRAQAAYVHIHKFSKISLLVAPKLNLEEEKDEKISNWYWDRVIHNYKINQEEIYLEIKKYIQILAEPNFKRFNGLKNYYEKK